ncbi:MAG: hypothetical protein MI974_08770 [Chitinophagales bacterium]|nr:hypothetical protein [Chitinophagales bacterium]
MSFIKDFRDKGALIQKKEGKMPYLHITLLLAIVTSLSGFEQLTILIDRILGSIRYVAELLFIIIVGYLIYHYITAKVKADRHLIYRYSQLERRIAKISSALLLILVLMVLYGAYQDFQPLPRVLEGRLICSNDTVASKYDVKVLDRDRVDYIRTGREIITDEHGYFVLKPPNRISRNSYLEFVSPSGYRFTISLRSYNQHNKYKNNEPYTFIIPVCN